MLLLLLLLSLSLLSFIQQSLPTKTSTTATTTAVFIIALLQLLMSPLLGPVNCAARLLLNTLGILEAEILCTMVSHLAFSDPACPTAALPVTVRAAAAAEAAVIVTAVEIGHVRGHMNRGLLLQSWCVR